jgi:hypothetical protein
MSIDRIHKSTSQPPVSGPEGAAGARGKPATEAFGVEKTARAEGATALSPAEQVRAGQMDMQTYLETRVQEATRHLEGKAPRAVLEQVRGVLREQLAHDPALQEMVREATGHAPISDE